MEIGEKNSNTLPPYVLAQIMLQYCIYAYGNTSVYIYIYSDRRAVLFITPMVFDIFRETLYSSKYVVSNQDVHEYEHQGML